MNRKDTHKKMKKKLYNGEKHEINDEKLLMYVYIAL